MAPKINSEPWTYVFGVLTSVAKAVPVLRVPVEGSIEALKQILQYTKVGGFQLITLNVST
jgi:phospholipid N-methyltransferase